MTLRFESTRDFEKELDGFQKKERDRIIQKLNQYTDLLDSQSSDFYKYAYRPLKLSFADDTESSLYVLSIGREIRIIMTVDDDPLFDQTLVTLLRVVRHSNLEKTFRGIAESIYQGQLNSCDEGADNYGSN